jgi:hypothetical protein
MSKMTFKNTVFRRPWLKKNTESADHYMVLMIIDPPKRTPKMVKIGKVYQHQNLQKPVVPHFLGLGHIK